ncbi:MAG: tetratricopeptide repeat protein [Bacteroidia bacterium]|nr:tetratricopeptide repeat protein [Bacteroidia bacterium]MBT8267840.1 tetratricopeptide repeat protein [Bacteroidia bacterium]NNF81656.1 tetratricopeptide repeat protein [Flavobacteriaceae bacterium]NNK69948.1 tetratricopeptide repeat protein [Flavobacteriaceae bacterium]NNL78917.1 tetratricopeptide repeat protein [Flavobacteriaceae bacterium]
MRTILLIISLFIGLSVSAQSEQVAKSYYDNGQFEKALIAYNKLYDENRGNINYFFKVVEIHQQLEQLEEAEAMLTEIINTRPNPQYYVELGYNFQLKGDEESAERNFELAKQGIEEKPVYAYYVARRFEDHALIDYAAQVYERAMELRPESNYNMQLARIYGEQGKIEKMFSSYIDFIEINTTYINFAKRSFSEYITEDSQTDNNKLLRVVLLKKIQQSPNVMWNELLSWLFIQQREYKKAFAQEKAIFTRQQESLQGVIDLALITIEENETEIAFEILDYIIEMASDLETVLQAHQNRLELLSDQGKESLEEVDNAYKALFMEYGRIAQTTNLQLSYANFMAFYLNRPNDAIDFLKEALDFNLSKFEEANIKMKLGDILVFQEKFNEALIYFSQIQQNLKNSTLAQEARFKVAKTSYYKGDFKWAESQLKILKSSTSQLIANDALDLKLLISDNKYEDSTQTALKLYAKADLFAYQNKTDEAIEILNEVLNKHKTETIVDQALLMQARLYEKKREYAKAENNYQRIINDFKDDILADDAYYALAEIYVNQLGQPEKAQEFYERIIFDHADSIFFVEARKKYRTLRGDSIN